MAKRRKSVEQQQDQPARRRPRDAAPALEGLGEQLLHEARAGQAQFVAGWKEFMKELGLRGKPIGARKLRAMLLRQGIKPDDNAFSRGIIAMREE
jgi:hypothetical protein